MRRISISSAGPCATKLFVRTSGCSLVLGAAMARAGATSSVRAYLNDSFSVTGVSSPDTAPFGVTMRLGPTTLYCTPVA
ncbi:MAG: hypothetical protein BWY85_02232 [Firmicutes bacterium ADurb.Bin506]|nr:MAG: hypothetical protein BWY85_02232 [Firmicutes bacterium ADurb.Bin506]